MSLTTSFQTAELTAPTAELRSAFAEMRREIEIMRRREEIREAEFSRLAAELEHAGRLQRQLVAGNLTTIRGATLSAFSHPAESISGDFHYAEQTSDSTVTLFVADSAGHGLAAGMLSVAVIGSIRSTSPREEVPSGDPAESLARLNHNLTSYALRDCEFVTAVCAEYDEATCTFRWSRAGAPPPILMRGGSCVRMSDSVGLPLGVEGSAVFSNAEMHLQAGDTVLLHTDGIEALHARCTGSRDDRDFLQWIAELARKDLHASLNNVADRHIQKTSAGSDQDDMTVLMLRVVG